MVILHSKLSSELACSELTPVMEETRHQISGFQDLSVFLIDLLNDRDSVYSRENSFEISGTTVKTSLICTGTPVKNYWIFCQS